MNKNKYLWIAVGIIALLLAFWGLSSIHNKQLSENAMQAPAQQTSASDMNHAPAQQPSATSSTADYSAALLKYANSRIQIQQSCQAVPNQVTYKSGTAVMFDNRATVAHTVKIDGISYRLSADSFRILVLANSNLPHTIMMDCDSSQNVATILLQK